MAPTVRLYAARVENLLFAPTIAVECLECEHKSEIAVEVKGEAARVKVLDIHKVVRCANCEGTGDRRRAARAGVRVLKPESAS